jgi:ADP-heptose:LPS heptosyltransferase
MSAPDVHPAFLLARKAAYRGLMLALRTIARPREQRRFRLAVLKLDRLGDAVLALGAMRRLMQHHGEAETLLIVSPVAEPLLRREFPGASFLIMPAFCASFFPDLVRTLARQAAALRGIAADALVCLRHQPSDYLHAISGLVNAKKVFATRWSGPRERTSLEHPRCQMTPYPEARDGFCRELEAHRQLLELVLGCDVALDEVMPRLASVLPAPGDDLLVCPAAGDALREYPVALLAEAVRLFHIEHPAARVRVCLPPGADRGPLAASFTHAGLDVSWILPEHAGALVSAIATAGVILAPESAPSHIATALDKPGVFLLGGGHHGLLAPWARSARQRWLSHPLPCYHCRWRCTQPEPFCITRITPGEVAAALVEACNARQK